MSCARGLEERLGGRWVGVRFHKGQLPKGDLVERPMRFCEAIAEAQTRPITLTKELLNCPGGQRSFGWDDNDETLVQTMTSKTGMDADPVRSIIRSTPYLQEKITGITIGTNNNSEVIVSLAQPELTMKIIRLWQRLQGTCLAAEVSTFMAACGAVVARAHLTRQICLSFGCPDSRSYGKIGRDRLVVGMPRDLAEELLYRI
ncbi:MAG TPA: DUF169 domain-containing protein [Thermodesulfobacteriota bacterium]|nr:DUF169 domain-containing protein [Thermodesulfobacteriota bacterium]HNU70296.1 DUF169 domain-containing protein [Thermodesulfobacteriota bacterium]HQO78087.1 DUF169 domain-containing protein [Thermodesulfobacteriota bacterium]